MECEPIKTPDGVVIVCGRRRRTERRKCFSRWCPRDAEKLCDYPIGDGKTCDRRCCDRHSRPVEGKADTDYCLEHALRKPATP